jgi:hypothetical protein
MIPTFQQFGVGQKWNSINLTSLGVSPTAQHQAASRRSAQHAIANWSWLVTRDRRQVKVFQDIQILEYC